MSNPQSGDRRESLPNSTPVTNSGGVFSNPGGFGSSQGQGNGDQPSIPDMSAIRNRIGESSPSPSLNARDSGGGGTSSSGGGRKTMVLEEPKDDDLQTLQRLQQRLSAIQQASEPGGSDPKSSETPSTQTSIGARTSQLVRASSSSTGFSQGSGQKDTNVTKFTSTNTSITNTTAPGAVQGRSDTDDWDAVFAQAATVERERKEKEQRELEVREKRKQEEARERERMGREEREKSDREKRAQQQLQLAKFRDWTRSNALIQLHLLATPAKSKTGPPKPAFERKPSTLTGADLLPTNSEGSTSTSPSETWVKEKMLLAHLLTTDFVGGLGSTVEIGWAFLDIVSLLPTDNILSMMVWENFTTSTALFTKVTEVKETGSGKGGREFTSMFLPKLFAEVIAKGNVGEFVEIISKSPGFLLTYFLPFLEDRKDGPLLVTLGSMAEKDSKKLLAGEFIDLCSKVLEAPQGISFGRSSFVANILLIYFEKAGIRGTPLPSGSAGGSRPQSSFQSSQWQPQLPAIQVDSVLVGQFVPILSVWVAKTANAINSLGDIDQGSGNSSSSSGGGSSEEAALFSMWEKIFLLSEQLAQSGGSFPELGDEIKKYFERGLLVFFDVLMKWNVVKREERVTWAKKFLQLEDSVQNYVLLVARRSFIQNNFEKWLEAESESGLVNLFAARCI